VRLRNVARAQHSALFADVAAGLDHHRAFARPEVHTTRKRGVHGDVSLRAEQRRRVEPVGRGVAVGLAQTEVVGCRAGEGVVDALRLIPRGLGDLGKSAIERLPRQLHRTEPSRLMQARIRVVLQAVGNEERRLVDLIVAIRLAVGVAQRQIERNAGKHLGAGADVESLQLCAVFLVALARDVVAAGAALCHRQRTPDPVVSARDAGRAAIGRKRSRLPHCAERQRSAAAARDDVDNAADGARTVEPALRPAQNFDLLDIFGREVREVELAVEGVVGFNAIDEHEGVIAFGAAQAHLRQSSRTTRTADEHAGQAADRFGPVAHLALTQLLTGDDRDGRADLVRRNGGERVTAVGCVECRR